MKLTVSVSERGYIKVFVSSVCAMNVESETFRVWLSMADAKIRSRQESTDSLDSSSHTVEDYSSEEDVKDGMDIDDFHIIKTVGTCWFLGKSEQ